jgi:hypothetical protein
MNAQTTGAGSDPRSYDEIVLTRDFGIENDAVRAGVLRLRTAYSEGYDAGSAGAAGNPYDEDQAVLAWAWGAGHRAAQSGVPPFRAMYLIRGLQ